MLQMFKFSAFVNSKLKGKKKKVPFKNFPPSFPSSHPPSIPEQVAHLQSLTVGNEVTSP